MRSSNIEFDAMDLTLHYYIETRRRPPGNSYINPLSAFSLSFYLSLLFLLSLLFPLFHFHRDSVTPDLPFARIRAAIPVKSLLRTFVARHSFLI